MSGETLLAGVIGDPVRHSLSPAIFDAAFEARGLDWTYLAFEVGPADLGAAIGGIGALGIRGLSVTMPHKAAVLDLLDDVTPAARQLQAVNCISHRDGVLVGDNTDGAGFLAALEAAGVPVSGRHVVVVGAGGAARAIAHALGGAGAEWVTVVNRTADRAAATAALAGPAGRVGGLDEVPSADVVVNATSVGMAPQGGLAVDPQWLRAHQVVVDAVYHPLRTPLLDAAEAVGARTLDGVGMLIGQAAVAFELWTGEVAPLDAMRAAVDRRLAG